jgi:hypothetical protein
MGEMKIAVLGTGEVGQTLAGAFAAVGHDVVVGTRDPEATRARTEEGRGGRPPVSAWLAEHPAVTLATYADAAAAADVVVNASPGDTSVEVVTLAGAANLAGKVLIDVTNALDFSAASLRRCSSRTLFLAPRKLASRSARGDV